MIGRTSNPSVGRSGSEDLSGEYVPISGTAADKPVTGPIQHVGGDALISIDGEMFVGTRNADGARRSGTKTSTTVDSSNPDAHYAEWEGGAYIGNDAGGFSSYAKATSGGGAEMFARDRQGRRTSLTLFTGPHAETVFAIKSTASVFNGLRYDRLPDTITRDTLVHRGFVESVLDGILAGISGAVVPNIAARDAYDVPKELFAVLVENDGDGKWALYWSKTIGVGATFIKISDQDTVHAALTPEAIKLAYESNLNTNSFTNYHKARVESVEEGATWNPASPTVLWRDPNTGVVSEGTEMIIGSVPFYALGEEVVSVKTRGVKSGTTSSISIRLYLTPKSDSLDGAILLGTYVTDLSTRKNAPFARLVCAKDGRVHCMNASHSRNNDYSDVNNQDETDIPVPDTWEGHFLTATIQRTGTPGDIVTAREFIVEHLPTGFYQLYGY